MLHRLHAYGVVAAGAAAEAAAEASAGSLADLCFPACLQEHANMMSTSHRQSEDIE